MPRADTNLRYRVKPISAAAVSEYLSSGVHISRKGVTVYQLQKPTLEVGFLIKKRTGNAVQRNLTRRLFWGVLNNHDLSFGKRSGYLFLFHRAFSKSDSLFEALNGILTQAH